VQFFDLAGECPYGTRIDAGVASIAFCRVNGIFDEILASSSGANMLLYVRIILVLEIPDCC
jgi:hypothetical protein